MNVHRNERMVKEMYQYIIDHMHDSLTVNDLAGQFGYSTGQLNRILIAVIGVTASLYIKSIKIEQAKKWLKDSEMTVTEIANALGYEYENHFSRMFLKTVGMKPMTYRKLQENHDAKW